MLYVRGNKWDYDHWASLANLGWSYSDVLPLFKRSENNEQFKDNFHGQGGPLNVTYQNYESAITSVPLLTDDSQIGANLQVCADEENRADWDQRG